MLTSSMFVIASSSMRAMSDTNSARDPVGSSPHVPHPSSTASRSRRPRATVDHHQPSFGGFNKHVDTLVENLSFLHQVDFLWREMIALLRVVASETKAGPTNRTRKQCEQSSGDHGSITLWGWGWVSLVLFGSFVFLSRSRTTVWP